MKTLCKPSAIALALVTLHLSPFAFRLHASVPLAWDVRPGQPAPVMFDRYHGETIDFSATFRGFGELPFSPGADVRLWYQTNGMGAAWWSAPATVSSNVLSATWSPALDPGADRVSLFFGAPSNAYAAAVLRLRHSPGFAPGALPDPIAFHESDPVFSEWLATNTLSSTLGATIAEAEARIGAEIVAATNAVRVVRKFDPGVDAWTVSGAMDLRLGKERDGYYVGTSGGKTYALLYTWHEWTFGTAQDNATVAGEPASTNLAFEIGGATYALSKGEWVDVPLATLDDIPSADLTPSTNYTDRAFSAFAETGTVERARSYGTPTRWTDANGDVWEALDVWQGDGVSLIPNGVNAWSSNDDDSWLLFNNGTWTAGIDARADVFSCSGQEDDTSLVMQGEYGTITLNRTITTNLAGRVALTNDIPTVPEWAKEPSPPSYSAADVGAAPASIVPVITTVSNAAETAKLNAETALRIVLGESVWFAVTNYMRTVEGVIPSLQLWEVRDSATNLVYDSREEITNTVRVLTSELRAELEARIPSKAWGNYQSDGTDNPEPGKVAIVNQPTVILTGGGTFNKYVEVGDSSVWVLQSSGPVSFGGNTNGNFFAVLDDEGNAHFRVAKTDSYDLPAFISDVLPRQSQNHILIYTATTNRHGNAVSEHPTLSVCSDLKDSLWYEEVEGEIDALGISVSWARDDTIPAWVATVTPDTYPPHLFFRCKVKQEGGVAVINTAPTRFDGGIQIGNGTYRLVPYTSGGKTYLTVEGMP
jgi:hypothetical protein